MRDNAVATKGQMSNHHAWTVFLSVALACLIGITADANAIPGPKGIAPSLRPSSDAAACRLLSPYVPTMLALKGQLHAHSNATDGRDSPTAVVHSYREAGYDFVAITDHNQIVTHDVSGALFVPGSEDGNGCQHANRIGAKSSRSRFFWGQASIDVGNAEDAFTTINHPDWRGRGFADSHCWSWPNLVAARDYDALEIWNWHGFPSQYDYERHVDPLLTLGRRFTLMVGDDCHDIRNGFCRQSHTIAYMDEASADAIVNALKSGNYYSSIGPAIGRIFADGLHVGIELPAPAKIEFVVVGGRTASSIGYGDALSYAARPEDRYVRLRVTDTVTGRKAWSNPLYVVCE